MRADHFLTWAFYARGLCTYMMPRLSFEFREALLNEWLALGCPYPVGV